MLIFNAHVHLNGSVSLEYLQATAVRNHCQEIYQQFLAEKDLWKKFGLIHKIMQTPEDIKSAVIDVIKHSEADVLEIRTTPKQMGEHPEEAYVQAFVQGLQAAAQLYPHKQARGLLSIDRSRHTLVDATRIIDMAQKEKLQSGMIVGVDLSGNFEAQRKITGKDLYKAVQYAFGKELGLALHVGEIDSPDERQDFDFILQAAQEYEGKLQGKLRLGHVIYRTAQQNEVIQKLKIPVETCPSCNHVVGWHQPGDPYPLTTLYTHRKRVIPGTDNSLLFECKEKGEHQKVDSHFLPSENHLGLPEEEQQIKVAQKRKKYMFF